MRPFLDVLGVIGKAAGFEDLRRRKAGGAVRRAAAEEDTVGCFRHGIGEGPALLTLHRGD